MPATTTPSPLFFEVAAVYHTQNRVVIRHRYAKGYRAEMSIADLARAAGKLDVSAEPVDATYLRLWEECRQTLTRRGCRPACDVTQGGVVVSGKLYR